MNMEGGRQWAKVGGDAAGKLVVAHISQIYQHETES
jgi:hypothetical protein